MTAKNWLTMVFFAHLNSKYFNRLVEGRPLNSFGMLLAN